MSPEMMHDPPEIDPREHAIESRHWGACSCHLVRHEGRYYAGMAAAAGRPLVYPMAGETAARACCRPRPRSRRVSSCRAVDPRFAVSTDK